MINKKVNRIFSCILFLYSILLLLLSIINSFILSSKTEAYKNFIKLADNKYEYIAFLLIESNYFHIITEDKINKIIDNFINLESNESYSVTSRIIISIISIIFTL